MNFFRSLGGALMVSMFGAIVLGGGGAGHERVTLETLATEGGQSGGDLAMVFRWVFVAAACCLTLGLACLLVMEERPLRGRSQSLPARQVPAE
jgi:hypothetical protein